MKDKESAAWVLKIAVAGEFIGHGVFAIEGKKDWVGWIVQMAGVNQPTAIQLLFLIGVVDIALAILTLVKPVKIILLWMVFWGFWTALVRPLVGLPIWDFVERWANWGAPLALLLLPGWPRKAKDWVS